MTCVNCEKALSDGESQTYKVQSVEDGREAELCDVYCLEDWVHQRIHEGPSNV